MLFLVEYETVEDLSGSLLTPPRRAQVIHTKDALNMRFTSF
jgi:hypothetical protein